jgi:hypothetical protein
VLPEGRDRPEEVVEEIALRLHERKLVLFVGSGLSKYAGLCDSKDLLQSMVKEMRSRVRPHYSALMKMAKSKDYYLTEYLYRFRSQYYKAVKSALKEPPRLKKNAHDLITTLPIAGIVTTNYDLLIEQAYERNGIPIHQFAYPNIDSFNQFYDEMKNADDRPFLVHIHGRYKNEEDCCKLILRPTNYVRYYYQNDELKRFLEWLRNNYSIFFVGYSFSDIELRRTIELASNYFLDEERAASANYNYVLMDASRENLASEDIFNDTMNTRCLYYESVNNDHSDLYTRLQRIAAAVKLVGEAKEFVLEIEALDRLKALTTVTDEDAAELKELLSDERSQGYFFDNLANPAWFDFLNKEGYFDNPPELGS